MKYDEPRQKVGDSLAERAHTQALHELREERLAELVIEEKERLLTHRTFWQRLFPWRIRLERR